MGDVMNNKKKGMTLVEVIAVIAIFGIISVVIYSFLGSSNKIFTNTYGQSILEDEIRTITSVFEDNIKTGKKQSFAGDTATFKNPSGGADKVVPITGTSVSVIYAFSQGGKDYAYILEGSSSRKQFKKIDCTTAPNGQEIAVLSKNVESLTLDTSKIPYKLSVKLNDEKEKPNTRLYEAYVTPRNK